MVFATRRTWVDPEYVPTFLQDDGYTPLSNLTEAHVGDVIIYRKDRNIEHAGVVIERHENPADATVSLKVLSKWGPWAEFIHDPEDVWESYGKPVEAWTDRKTYE